MPRPCLRTRTVLESGDELGHRRVTFHSPELVLGFQQTGSDPAKDHRRSAPALHSARVVLDDVEGGLDRVRGDERPSKRTSDSEAVNGQGLVFAPYGAGAGGGRAMAVGESPRSHLSGASLRVA